MSDSNCAIHNMICNYHNLNDFIAGVDEEIKKNKKCLNALNANNFTPLSLACQHLLVEPITYLLTLEQVDISIKHFTNLTAFEMVIDQLFRETFDCSNEKNVSDRYKKLKEIVLTFLNSGKSIDVKFIFDEHANNFNFLKSFDEPLYSIIVEYGQTD